jgi:hypothetical protein
MHPAWYKEGQTADPTAWAVELSERAQDKRPTVPHNVRGPASIDVRLDQLCDLLDKANHARPSRDLLVSALVYAADANVDALESLLTNYRGATHSEVLVDDQAESGKIDLEPIKSNAAARSSS